ncbi:MAG TPA: dihydropteroate synthase [Gemmatimonadales bacterium]|nr:dihydropteroate synthase [Gemmatimonadales bacterium]
MGVAPLVVTPLAARSPRGIAAVLGRGGMEPGAAETAAAGMTTAAFRIVGLDDTSLEALVHFGGQLGLDVMTGRDWAVISGARSRLGALARPWTVPEPLRDLAYRLGLAMPAELPRAWRTARGPIALDAPVLMGILNVTPDSFSDGGRHAGVDRALRHAERLLEDGATILDVGGESTRPGRTAVVPAEEELARVVPVVQAVAQAFPAAFISIDTMKSVVARGALDAGAAIVNDVTGLRHDPHLGRIAAAAGAGLVVMHSRGVPLELASVEHADYGGDVVGGVLAELRQALDRAGEAGLAAECVAVDPGLGFSKTAAQNLLVTDQLEALLSLGQPVLVGPSRKRFLGAATGRDVAERDAATAAACALAWERGARIFRVHDVAAARDALAVAHALGHSASAS